MSSIPVDDPKAFEKWLYNQWLIKEDLLEQYSRNGRFPADDGRDGDGESAVNGNAPTKVLQGAGFIETKVQLAHWYEVGSIFVVMASCALLANILAKVWNLVYYGTLIGKD